MKSLLASKWAQPLRLVALLLGPATGCQPEIAQTRQLAVSDVSADAIWQGTVDADGQVLEGEWWAADVFHAANLAFTSDGTWLTVLSRAIREGPNGHIEESEVFFYPAVARDGLAAFQLDVTPSTLHVATGRNSHLLVALEGDKELQEWAWDDGRPFIINRIPFPGEGSTGPGLSKLSPDLSWGVAYTPNPSTLQLLRWNGTRYEPGQFLEADFPGRGLAFAVGSELVLVPSRAGSSADDGDVYAFRRHEDRLVQEHRYSLPENAQHLLIAPNDAFALAITGPDGIHRLGLDDDDREITTWRARPGPESVESAALIPTQDGYRAIFAEYWSPGAYWYRDLDPEGAPTGAFQEERLPGELTERQDPARVRLVDWEIAPLP